MNLHSLLLLPSNPKKEEQEHADQEKVSFSPSITPFFLVAVPGLSGGIHGRWNLPQYPPVIWWGHGMLRA
jgi:hypothetical protein